MTKIAGIILMVVLHSTNLPMAFSASGGLRDKSRSDWVDEAHRILQGGTCGNGYVGNGVCADTRYCCSQYGYCGTTSSYCTGGTCGNGNRGNGVCADTKLCCSQYGWCGNTADYCGSGSGPSPTPAPVSSSGISSPPKTLSVSDLQAAIDVYNSFWGSNIRADQTRVDQLNSVTTKTQNGWTLYRQVAFVAQTIWESGAYVYTEEQAAVKSPYTTKWNYQDCDWNQAGTQYPANGKAFYGRGYIQLSWCANYKAYGKGRMINGDADYFYKNPELVATTYAMDSAAWIFENNVKDTTGQFGLTTKAINGAIECTSGYTGNAPQRRYQIFDALAKKVGLTGYSSAGCY